MRGFRAACLLFVVALWAFAPPARAVDMQPGSSCASFAAGVYRPTGGPENPDGALVVCDGSIWQPILRYSSVGNAVMFASTGLAAAPLQVWGEAIIGNQGLACTAPAEGALRYTSSSDSWEYCNGSAWTALVSSGSTGCPSVGDVCSDGSVYAGLSPDGSMNMYTTPADAPGQGPWNNGNTSGYVTTNQLSSTNGKANTSNLIAIDSDSVTAGTQPHQAAQYCADLSGVDGHGHDDWYMPAKDELNVLYANRAAIGGFDTSGAPGSGYYWSSTEYNNGSGWYQRFSDGNQAGSGKNWSLSLRCIRAVGANATAAGPDGAIQFNSGGILGADANFVVDSKGWFGIGTSTPQSKVHIVTDADYTGLEVEATGTNVPILDLARGASEWIIQQEAGDALSIGHWNAGTSTWTPALWSTSTGNIGIGTTAPQSALDVTGAIHTSDRINITGTTGLPAPLMP